MAGSVSAGSQTTIGPVPVVFPVSKFNDLNDNGAYDQDEPFLDGWEITVKDQDGNLLGSFNQRQRPG